MATLVVVELVIALLLGGRLASVISRADNKSQPAQGSNGSSSITRYGLGARGIDTIEETVAGGSAIKTYPLYDGHGNMLATISLSGTLSNKRTYDIWGGVRAQNGISTNPSERHVGNLGHKADDESGLIYMRARYYDPGSGRFVTEDPARDGANWFVYCNNDPVNKVDVTGRTAIAIGLIIIGTVAFGLGYMAGRAIALRGLQNHARRNDPFHGGANKSRDVLDAVTAAHTELRSRLVDGLGAGLIAIGLNALVGAGAATPAGLTIAVSAFIGFLIGFMDVLLTALLVEVVWENAYRHE